MDTVCTVEGFPPENSSKHMEFVGKQGGGAASQTIVTFQRLGGSTGYIGVPGTDDIGTWLLEDLKNEGVDISFVTREEGISSFSFVCSNKCNASRTLFNYHDKLPGIQFTKDMVEYISRTHYLHLDGTMYGNAIKLRQRQNSTESWSPW
jgi:sugar/nucleoside kinase (ribokinase family)